MTEEKQVTGKCNACGSSMVLRKSSFGSFYGCTEYPRCKYTEPAADDAEKPEPTSNKEVFYDKGKPVMPNKPTNGNGKECKLTEESIRSNALRCAIEDNHTTPADGFWRKVREFEDYIRNGN